MIILYIDCSNKQRIDATAQAPDIIAACTRYMLLPAAFDYVVIDLRGDIEAAEFYDTGTQRRVSSMGGASAWGVYRELAAMFPSIAHHLPPSPSERGRG